MPNSTQNVRQPSRELIRRFAGCLLILVAGSLSSSVFAETGAIQFNRDIRPILSNACFACHGQDAAKRAADLRLDTEEGQRQSSVVIPGDPTSSLLMERIRSVEADVVMPPPESNKSLSEAEKDLLEKWIEEGGSFENHWSLTPPNSATISPTEGSFLHPIDFFVRQKLKEKKLSPSPPADPVTLIRRVSLDLTGLPPSRQDVQDFQQNPSDEQYERIVDRLLASPAYGERLALPWLDAARYADTHGYQKDNHRTMWPWRDWVVQAFNRNLPFDQFSIEQLAGDLLDQPTIDQRLATGFQRNHRINAEAGSIEEEFLFEYAADRVETFATVWLGLTVGCARCHDHKFDPITQKDFYQLLAFFNNIPERGVDGVGPAPEPKLEIANESQQDSILKCQQEQRSIQEQSKDQLDRLRDRFEAWQTLDEGLSYQGWIVPNGLELTSAGKMSFEKLGDHSVLVGGENPLNDVHRISFPFESGTMKVLRLEVLTHRTMTDEGFARSFDGRFICPVSRLNAPCQVTQRRSSNFPKSEPTPSVMVGQSKAASIRTPRRLGRRISRNQGRCRWLPLNFSHLSKVSPVRRSPWSCVTTQGKSKP
jgi:hypothetical protein